MRLIIRFSKEERVKYISHLDLMRTLQRALRRAKIPVAFSQGFNPQPRLAFASALAVGMTSEGEYMDILLEQDLEPEEFCNRMNEVLPLGIRMLEGIKVSREIPSLMSLVERADYLIKFPEFTADFFSNDKIEKFLAQDEIVVQIKRKRGLRNVNIRKMIHHMEWTADEAGRVLLKARVSAGSKANLKPNILAQSFLDWAGLSMGENEPLVLHRLNMYIPKGNRWVTPMEIE